ncbi:MAG: oligosaccharide biosynthesis protein Alg14 [Rhodobacteraceae bacterium]|nr:oligosaccharide biosynthesis protein Alg14 [Paracoccaceae bacterium]
MRRPRVLALSSGGGHWIQLLRLRPAFAGCDVVFATVDPGNEIMIEGAEFHVFPDANKDTKVALIKSVWAIWGVLRRVKPDVIVSTGAAGGFFAVLIGRAMGTRGVFIDSIANAQTLSVSARLVLKTGGTVYTQWPDLADSTGAQYLGAVI